MQEHDCIIALKIPGGKGTTQLLAYNKLAHESSTRNIETKLSLQSANEIMNIEHICAPCNNWTAQSSCIGTGMCVSCEISDFDFCRNAFWMRTTYHTVTKIKKKHSALISIMIDSKPV